MSKSPADILASKSKAWKNLLRPHTQRYQVEHAGNAYYVIDTDRERHPVALYSYHSELDRGQAHYMARADMQERNAKAEGTS